MKPEQHTVLEHNSHRHNTCTTGKPRHVSITLCIIHCDRLPWALHKPSVLSPGSAKSPTGSEFLARPAAGLYISSSSTAFFVSFWPMFDGCSAANWALRHWARHYGKVQHSSANLQNTLDTSLSMAIVISALYITLVISGNVWPITRFFHHFAACFFFFVTANGHFTYHNYNVQNKTFSTLSLLEH